MVCVPTMYPLYCVILLQLSWILYVSKWYVFNNKILTSNLFKHWQNLVAIMLTSVLNTFANLKISTRKCKQKIQNTKNLSYEDYSKETKNLFQNTQTVDFFICMNVHVHKIVPLQVSRSIFLMCAFCQFKIHVHAYWGIVSNKMTKVSLLL